VEAHASSATRTHRRVRGTRDPVQGAASAAVSEHPAPAGCGHHHQSATQWGNHHRRGMRPTTLTASVNC